MLKYSKGKNVNIDLDAENAQNWLRNFLYMIASQTKDQDFLNLLEQVVKLELSFVCRIEENAPQIKFEWHVLEVPWKCNPYLLWPI